MARTPDPAFNLRVLADAKKLPLDFLTGLGVTNYAGGRVQIEYRLEDGSPSPMGRYRTSLGQLEDEHGRKKPKFLWEGSGGMVPYGLWMLANLRSKGELGNDLYLVEGESDCWAGWFHGLQVLGIPGATNWKCLQLSHIAGIKNLIAVREPGPGGDAFIKGMGERLATIGWRGGHPTEISLPTKDLSDLHIEKIDQVEGPDNDPAFNVAVADARLAEKTIGLKPRFNVLSSADLVAADFTQKFLIKKILVANQPAICGGRSKTLKTSIMIDMALSLGTGTPFLGQFETKQATVWVISGESGGFTIKETASRIAREKGIDLRDADVYWGFDLPQLSNSNDIDALAAEVQSRGIEVLMIDPAYLCLLAGSTGVQASDVMRMGPLLGTLTELGRTCQCTVVLCHHARKSGSGGPRGDNFVATELEDLSMAGFAEWARQWLLLGRREAYSQGSGIHKLWMNVGGSAGHSGCYPLDIDEGRLADDFTGRTWKVQIMDQGEVKDALKREAKDKKARQAQEAENDQVARMRSAIAAAGETGGLINDLRHDASLTSEMAKRAIAVLKKRGEIAPCKISRDNGQTYPGWRATSDMLKVVEDEYTSESADESTNADPWSAGHWD